MRCKTCHYSLTNLKEHRCPECGRAFRPADPSTWESDSVEVGRRRMTWVLLVAVIVIALFLIAALIPVIANYPL